MTTISKIDAEALRLTSNDASGKAASMNADWLMPEFHPGLGDHPLWQALMDEIEKNRQADIAEANLLADLELADLELAESGQGE